MGRRLEDEEDGVTLSADLLGERGRTGLELTEVKSCGSKEYSLLPTR